MNNIVRDDLKRIFDGLKDEEKKKFYNSVILITGCAGFLGFYFMNFFLNYAEELKIKKIIGLDNFKVGYPNWLKELISNEKLELHEFDIISNDISSVEYAKDATYIFHMASIASPMFYRTYPIETLDANVWGLRNLLDFYKDIKIKGFAFFSSSEIYGDATADNIPTSEEYRGNVSCLGPRACYDEAKRFGETMCYLYNKKYDMPITIIRPFNNYGPGMRLNDKRVPADFAKAIYEGRDIVMLSDGSPTRTFCYITDAITGYLKVLLYDKFEAFNIGTDKPEISIKELADIYKKAGEEILNYKGNVKVGVSEDKDYLTNNPNRRCPDINKARTILGYEPKISVNQGIRLFLEFIKESKKEDLEW